MFGLLLTLACTCFGVGIGIFAMQIRAMKLANKLEWPVKGIYYYLFNHKDLLTSAKSVFVSQLQLYGAFVIEITQSENRTLSYSAILAKANQKWDENERKNELKAIRTWHNKDTQLAPTLPNENTLN